MYLERNGLQNVFPTTVGMNRILRTGLRGCMCVPHDRGDEPNCTCRPSRLNRCSPRPWG